MNNRAFTRKIIYITLIAGLLIPLSYVARPASVEPQSGGHIANLRDEFRLSQGQMTEVDPASETMKLASLGMRGVAVNLLWMQATEYKKKHNWDGVESTLNALVKIQPNFIKVWEFQAHNMSYNISREFDDYEFRYRWVKKGISFLTKGLKPNYRDHRMTDNLGQFTGSKLGVSDEKKQFRRIFRSDSEFHEEMALHGIDKRSYFVGEPYEYDNYLLSYQWYDKSRKKVDDQSFRQRSSDMMFYQKRPAQLRNAAAAIGKEFRTDEAIQLLWSRAHDEWSDYGRIPLGNTLGQVVSLEDLTRIEEEMERKRRELDALAPEGLRDEIVAEIESKLELSEEELAALDVPDDLRDDTQLAIAKGATYRLNQEMAKVDEAILTKIPESDRFQGRKIVNHIARLLADMRTIDKYKGTINYRYWRIRTLAEKDEIAILARQLMDDAQELKRRSIFDDEYVVDPKTGEKQITKRGALSTFEDCYEKFALLLDQYPRLSDGALADEVIESLEEYQEMRKIAGLDWPDDFVLQDLIDEQADGSSFRFKLPTSEMLRQEKIESGEIDPEEVEETDGAEDADGTDEEEQPSGEPTQDVGEAGNEAGNSDDSNAPSQPATSPELETDDSPVEKTIPTETPDTDA